MAEKHPQKGGPRRRALRISLLSETLIGSKRVVDPVAFGEEPLKKRRRELGERGDRSVTRLQNKTNGELSWMPYVTT